MDHARGLWVPVPPIVDLDLAATARAALTARYRRPPPQVRVPSLLTGLATCALCGERIGVALGHRRATYRCLGRRYDRYDRCDLPTCRARPVDARLWEALTDVLTSATTIDRALAYLRRDAPTVAGDPITHRAELDRLDRAQASILAQLARGTVSQEVADAQIDRLGKARRDAQDALQRAERQPAAARLTISRDDLAAALANLARGCELAGPDLRHRAARALIDRAVWRPGSIAADLTIDVASQVADSSRSNRHQGAFAVPLGQVRIATGRRMPLRVAA